MNSSQLNQEVFSIRKEIQDAKIDLEKYKLDIEKLVKLKSNFQEAIKILTIVLGTTQEEIVTFIEDIVTSALQHVYGEDYKFRIEFIMKRNQAEVMLVPYKGDMVYDCKLSCGGGILDIISFALRIACLALVSPQPDQVIILDEPFRNISGQEQLERCGDMIRELSRKYGLQIILITAKSIIINYVDKSFDVIIDSDGISHVSS